MPASNRTERLLNLVIALLATRHWLTKEQIRRAVPQYADCENAEAFDRMFERDKDDLRELGVPLVTGNADIWSDDVGYRIDRGAYALPAIDLTPAELAVLGLASRVWQQASLAGPAARALTKLKALGVSPDDDSLVGVEPRLRATEPSFEPLYAAMRDGAPVAFGYRKRGASATSEERRVEPWALTSRGGWWYLVGHDRGRGAPRAFKLSRIDGRIRRVGESGTVRAPAGLDVGAMVRPIRTDRDGRVARVRVRQGRGGTVRLREGVSVVGAVQDGDGPGWDVVELPIGEVTELAEQLAGFAGDVVVLEPDDLRRAVVGLLRGALTAHQGVGGPR